MSLSPSGDGISDGERKRGGRALSIWRYDLEGAHLTPTHVPLTRMFWATREAYSELLWAQVIILVLWEKGRMAASARGCAFKTSVSIGHGFRAGHEKMLPLLPDGLHISSPTILPLWGWSSRRFAQTILEGRQFWDNGMLWSVQSLPFPQTGHWALPSWFP